MKVQVFLVILCFHFDPRTAQVIFNPDPEGDVQLQVTVLTPHVEVTTVQCYASSPQFKVQYVTLDDNKAVHDVADIDGSPVSDGICWQNRYSISLVNLKFIADPTLIGGTFRLKVTIDNNVSSLSKRTYSFPAPFNLTGSSVSAVLNSAFTWTCHVTSDYPIIEWFQGSTNLGQSGILNGNCVTFGLNDSYIYNCQPPALTYTLTIPGPSLTEDLQGSVWRCKDVFNELMGSKFIELNIVVPVTTVTISPGSGTTLYVDESETVTFSCDTNDANPPATILWFIGSSDVTSQAGFSKTTLTLNVTRIYHQMTVRCQASNSGNTANLSDSTILNVRYDPVVTIEQSSLEVIEGRSAELRCSATGNPAPNVTWYRGSTPVTGSTISTSTYSTVNISRTYTGNYTCIATSSSAGSNIVQPDQKTVYLRVFYPLTVSILLQNTTEYTGNHVIKCLTEGDPNNSTIIALQQTIGSTLIRNITSFTESSPGNVTLIIPRVSYQDMGTYTCLASNGIPDRNSQKIQSDTTYFNVITSAKFEIKQYTVRLDVGTPAAIVIPFYRNPPATESDIVWTKDSGSSDETLASSANVTLSLRDADVQQMLYGVDVTLRGQSAIVNITSFQSFDEGSYTLKIGSSHSDSADVAILLIRSGPPDTPSDFQLVTRRVTSIVLRWSKGSDGGHPQIFVILYKEKSSEVYNVIQIYDTTMNISITNEIKSLKPNTSYEFILYSFNEKGNSTGHIALEERTLKVDITEPRSIGPSMAGVAGGVTAGVLVTIVIAITIIVLRKKRQKPQKGSEDVHSMNQRSTYDELQNIRDIHTYGRIGSSTETQLNSDERSNYEELQAQRDAHTYDHLGGSTDKKQDLVESSAYEDLQVSTDPHTYQQIGNSNFLSIIDTAQ